MSEMMQVKAEETGGLSLVSPIPAASSSELEQKQDNKDLIHQVSVIKEEVSHDWSPSMDQMETETPHIKDEEQDQWISLEEEHLTVKIEDEEKPQLSELLHLKSEHREIEAPTTSSSTEQMERKPDGQDCGGPQPGRNLVPVRVSNKNRLIAPKICKPYELCSTVTSQYGVKTEDKPFGCTMCEKRFKRKHSVKIHMMVHTGKVKHICDLCGKTFRVKISLQTHMRVHNGEKPFACDICSKRFYAKAYLKLHMKLHSAEHPYSCDVCGAQFKIKKRLDEHMRRHKGEKPHFCHVCNKAFAVKDHLKNHMRVHTGEKPFTCHICGKRFSQSGGLKKHIAVHAKQFSCSECGKCFVKRMSLERHMRLHSEERPFGCDVCKSRFKQKCHLDIHMKIHSGE